MSHLRTHGLFGITLSAIATLPLVAQRADPGLPTGQVDVARSAGLQRIDGADALRGDGADYRVWFGAGGMRFEPALGRAVAATQHLALAPIAVHLGTAVLWEPLATTPPAASDLVASYQRTAAICERFAVGPAGVELSWRFAAPLAGSGDLVVRYAVDTSLPAPRADGEGLAFELTGIGGVRIGGVTGIDAGGARCPGRVRWVDGQLELSLPAEFVAAAHYPLVLDPTIGTIVTVNSEIYDDSDPDVAYDADEDCYLAVWLRTFSGVNSDVRGQRIAGDGALLGSSIHFGSTGVAERPRVANSRTYGRFGVVWAQQSGGTSSVEFASVAATGGITHVLTVVSSTTTLFHDADIGCETRAAYGAERDFVVAFRAGSSIQVRRVWFTLAGSAVAGGGVATILQATPLFATYSQPAIARTAAGDGMLLVVARRTSVGNADQIVAVAVRSFAWLIGSNPTATIANAGAGETLLAPDVDGYDSRWVVAWQRDGASDTVARAPVSLGAGLVVGAAQSLSGPPGFTASTPSIGYGPGKAWLGYRSTALLGGASLAVRGIDAASGASGSDGFSEAVTGSEARIVVATQTSSGLTTGDDALAVWAEAGNVYAQRLVGHSNGGAIQNLGGGCGQNRGTQTFSHNPAIGSNGFRCQISGLLPISPTIFNFSAPAPAVSCGACSWLPFSVTVVTNSDLGGAVVEFPIPYLQSLVGAQFETQWTTVNLGQAPCALVPDLVLSDRARLTIGQ